MNKNSKNNLHIENKEMPEEILAQALEMQQKGTPSSDIYRSFPVYREELEEIFQLLDILAEEKEKIVPEKEILKKIVAEVKLAKNGSFYNDQDVLSQSDDKEKYGLSLIQWFKGVILFPNNGGVLNKFAAAAIVILIALGGIFIFRGNPPVEPVPVFSLEGEVKEEITLNEKTFNEDSEELVAMGDDTALGDLGEGLNEIIEDKPLEADNGKEEAVPLDISAEELGDILNGLNDLEELNEDNFSDIDTGLGDIVQS